MNPKDFQSANAGGCVLTPRGYWAFVPNALPPPLTFSAGMVKLLSEADRALGELAGRGERLPNPHLLIRPYVLREAVQSSRIEGTQVETGQMFLFEAVPVQGELFSKPADVREVNNYVLALEYAISQDTLPLSLRLVREIHRRLMQGVRGTGDAVGEFRTRQNYIGPEGCSLPDASFVPPPPEMLIELLGDWESYLQSNPGEPTLVQCALMHYQFEAIHPFEDGNGRIGRLLITFFLCERHCLSQPLLYLSAFFERYRSEYYDRLLAVSRDGDWEGWIEFFLRGVHQQANDAIETTKRIFSLRDKYHTRISGKRVPKVTRQVLDDLFANPFVTAAGIRDRHRVSFPTAQRAVDGLLRLGVLREITGRRRNRIYCADEILRTFSSM